MQQPGKIYECIYLVGGPELTDRRDCCVYLIDGRTELALIDTGLGYSVQAILNNIKKLGLDSSLLKYVVATHGHIDHIGGLRQFQALGAKVVAHELEYDAIARGLPQLTAESYYRVQYQPVSIDLQLRGEEDDLTVGDLTLHCPLTPGHTPGGISPYVDIGGARILFGQDIHGPFNPSWGSDMDKWRSSMQQLLNLKADILCEGHFGMYKPADKVHSYIHHYLDQYFDD